MEIVNVQAQAYAEKYSSPEDDLLKEIAAFTYSQHAQPHMLSGHLQGKFLQMVSCMISPLRILEVGTFTGYSALCLAKGLAPGGQLHTIELRTDDAATAKAYFDRSLHREQIILHTGNAIEIIPQLNQLWDVVFIDADKENYIRYFNLVFPFIKPKGFILADNVLFHGQVLEAEVKGKNAKAIQAFNDFILAHEQVEKLMLPIRDGIYMLQKTG